MLEQACVLMTIMQEASLFACVNCMSLMTWINPVDIILDMADTADVPTDPKRGEDLLYKPLYMDVQATTPLVRIIMIIVQSI